MVGRTPAFRGRERERQALDLLLDRARDGTSAALVMRGEAGIGKTALLQYCARQASGCRLAQIAGVESELDLPFAALHQLCEPLLAGIDTLPEPQRHALGVAFGLTAGDAPDRFVVGLAVLGLLAEAAEERPLICMVDDAQWLDKPSRQVIAFVARRLVAESVVLLIAVREVGDERAFPALDSLTLQGLEDEDARALLSAAVSVHLDDHVRDRIVAETRGNPLRLIELPRGMSSGELAGGFGVPQAPASPAPMEEQYAVRIRGLDKQAQQLLLVAAADPTGDAALVWRAAQTLGVPRHAAAELESEQLLEIGARSRFRHPLVRSAAYAVASPDERRSAHSALAEATDPNTDAERRVWHLAAAAAAPDETVAAQLERAAVAAQARAGLAGAAALLQRAVELTAAPERRVDRALAAARAHLHAGAFDAAEALLAEARAAAIDHVQLGQVEQLAGEVQYRSNPGRGAAALLVEVAKTLERLDVQRARETYIQAWFASYAAGPYALPGGLLPEVSRAMKAAPAPLEQAPPWDLFFDPLAAVVLEGRAASADSYRRALDALCSDQVAAGDYIQWAHIASHAGCQLWDPARWDLASSKHVALARASGALAPLSIALNGRGVTLTTLGDFDGAAATVQEFETVNEATGIGGWFSAGGMFLAAYQGRPEALELMSTSRARFVEYGVGQGSQFANWTTAILCNGLGRYAEAFAAAHLAAYEMEIPNGTGWALIELVEAGVRTNQLEAARTAVEQLPKHTLTDSDWAMGVEARCRALTAEPHEAEEWFRESVERLQQTPVRTELARAQLLYGEWLRREGRRVDARHHLKSAFDMFSEMGAEAFGERARRELLATGEKVRKRDVSTGNVLTPQEEHIARLARDGRSNAEIGAELFLSVRTVEWHLRKVFQKLGIPSRRELKTALPSRYSGASTAA